MKLPFKVDLNNKVAVVTGGTGVLGSYWVNALAECGAKVAIIGRSLDSIEEKVREVIAAGGIAIGVKGDVLDKESLKRAHAEILERLGPCDILLNGAGGNNPKGTTTKEYLYEQDLNNTEDGLKTFFDLEEEGVRSVFDLNFMGTFLVSQEFARDMAGRKGCTIINISSMNAFTPLTKIPAYSGAKAAISNFTQWLAVHLSKVGVRVNGIAPGFFLTEQNKALLMNSDGTYTDRTRKILNSTPMERFGKPEELVGILLFLVNEEASSFVNGVVIPVDGASRHIQEYKGMIPIKNIKDINMKTHGGLKEKVLQIGEGNFLRAFSAWMIDRSNSEGVFDGSIVICQPISKGMADKINEQDCMYTLLMRGIENKETVERREVITSVSRCINPYEDYSALMEIAGSPELKIVISNTTEAGIVYQEGDKLKDKPPSSFPAKMTVILYERYKVFKGDPGKGLLMLPVELIDRNGDRLKHCVMTYAEEWQLDKGFLVWLEECNCFANTLVDRIVTGYPKDEHERLTEALGYEDNIMVACEPFHLWVIEAPGKWSNIMPFHRAGINIIWTDDMTPYRTRKVRILNGAHTVSVLAAYMAGYDTVLEMILDNTFEKYLRACIWEEIIPTIPLPEEAMEDYANAVLERFSNPFIKHRLLDISLNSVSKYKARCLPSLLDYIESKKALPSILVFGIAALIAFYKGDMENGKYIGKRGVDTYEIRDEASVLEFFQTAWSNPGKVVGKVLSNKDFWEYDLTSIKGLEEKTEECLELIMKVGSKAAILNILGRA